MYVLSSLLVIWLPLAVASAPAFDANTWIQETVMETIALPKPRQTSPMSVEEALAKRRSARSYAQGPLTLEEIGQLLWAAQGITDQSRGLRTAPSAGALYPLELYIVVGEVKGLAKGIYKYRPRRHDLVRTGNRDVRDELCRAALDQESVRDAAAVLAFAGVVERTAVKYGTRTMRYVYIEVGHASQNVFLQASALGLGTVVIGAFYDDEVKKVIGMDATESPLYIMPIGRLPK